MSLAAPPKLNGGLKGRVFFADKQPVADNTRKGAVMKRSQLAIKTMGKKTFTSGTRKAGQQPERNLDDERGLRAG